jgi:hypothetical protein
VEPLRLIPPCALSLLIHCGLLLLARGWVIVASPVEQLGTPSALVVDLAPAGGASRIEPARPLAPPPSPPARPTLARPAARPSHPIAKIPKTTPRFIDGVRVATADDVVRHAEQERAAIGTAAPPPGSGQGLPSVSSRGSPEGSREGRVVPEAAADDRPYRGPFRADSPGFNGRIFAQVSVGSSSGSESFYGRIHLFREDSVYRDYSKQSLFGYSFRQPLGEAATREFETGRVTTSGAYLAVTDLFADGHLSTMSHTVLFAFPRRPPQDGGFLYDVVEEPGGDFRLRGPAGSFLLFDGRTGALRVEAGFVVSPQGASGTPPQVTYRGFHLRIQAVGSNPFLRDRPATAVDAVGRECELSTSELFSYAGRSESDVLRFKSDGELFAFLRGRCAGLALPEPAPGVTRVAQAEDKPRENKPEHGEGLIPLLFRGFR